ncbi:helix-turn-helix transcriptional regulator [Bifidobacterium parmae]|nr:helix-turn-helix transcriptional regulator [Bifidobacterium parmae]
MSTTSYQRFLWTVGRRIQSFRKSRGLSQEQLAERLDMDRVSIGYIEQGRRSPKLSTLYAIAGVLGIHVYDIFIGAEPDGTDGTEHVPKRMRGADHSGIQQDQWNLQARRSLLAAESLGTDKERGIQPESR